MDERRFKPRWLINQRAELIADNGVRPIPCLVEDISQGGIRISLNRNLFDEVFSNFKLTLANEFELSIGAKVVRREQSYERNIYALSFNKISDSEKAGIDQYVKENFRDLIVKHWWEEGEINAGA
jgi:c-di-GMP-binding flagellar brake protein YcgR